MNNNKSFNEIRDILGFEDFTKFKLKAIAKFRKQYPDTVLIDSQIVKEVPCGKTTLMLVSALHYSQYLEKIYLKAYNDLITNILLNKVKNYADILHLDTSKFYGLMSKQYLFLNKRNKLYVDHYCSDLCNYTQYITHT